VEKELKFIDRTILGAFNFGMASYNKLHQIYAQLHKKYPKIFTINPSGPAKTKIFFNLLTKVISTQFEPLIRDELSFYLKHHFELEDLQDGLDMGNVLSFINETENLEGDILELGTYKCGTTIMMARFLKNIGSKRKVIGCDAFKGLPYDDKHSSQQNAKGMFSDVTVEYVLEKIKKFGVDDKITIIEGLFEETLLKSLSEQKFSMVLLDCDLYDAAKFSLEFAYPRLVEGGLIMFDDYDRTGRNNPEWGETKAVDEFCSSHNIKVNLHPVPHFRK